MGNAASLLATRPAAGATETASHALRGDRFGRIVRMLEFGADPSSPYHRPEFDPHRGTVLSCASGGRSALGAVTLAQLGYTDVRPPQRRDQGLARFGLRGIGVLDVLAERRAAHAGRSATRQRWRSRSKRLAPLAPADAPAAPERPTTTCVPSWTSTSTCSALINPAGTPKGCASGCSAGTRSWVCPAFQHGAGASRRRDRPPP